MICKIFTKNIDPYNVDKERKILIVFDDMIADIINNKKTKFNSNGIVYWRQKIESFSFFITQSYFKVPKVVRLNNNHFFITKIPKRGDFNKLPKSFIRY